MASPWRLCARLRIAQPSAQTLTRSLAVLLAGLVLGAGACDQETALPLLNVSLTEADTIATTITCATGVRTLVDESSAEVRVRLRGTVAPGTDERCKVDVTLDDPLGGRLLVDGRDDRGWRYVEGELKIVRLDGCTERSCEVDWSIDDNAASCDPGPFLLASIGTVVGARGDSVVSVRRCGGAAAVTAIDGIPYVWARSGSVWFVQSTLQDACAFRTDAAPVTDADCALLDR